jgi:transposase
MTTHICGIDIGKTVFHLVGLSKEGHIIVKKRFNRKQLLTYTVTSQHSFGSGFLFCLVG